MLHRTIFTLEIIADESAENYGINELAREMTDGDFSGRLRLISTYPLTNDEAAQALIEQGSDPSFLLGEEDAWPYTLAQGDSVRIQDKWECLKEIKHFTPRPAFCEVTTETGVEAVVPYEELRCF